jgi:tetratricopeptide (TPR) repeat protein
MKSIAKLKDLARAHEQREEWAKAVDVYRQLLAADVEGEVELSLYNRIGDICLRLGRPAEAVEYYAAAADRYAEAALYNNAIALCNKALRYQPELPDLYRRLGEFCAAQGFFTDARRWFLEYAERANKAGQLERAFQALEDFADLSNDPDIRELLGRQFQAKGRKAEAVDQLVLAHRLRLEAGESEAAAALEQEIGKIDPSAVDRLGGAAPVSAPVEDEWLLPPLEEAKTVAADDDGLGLVSLLDSAGIPGAGQEGTAEPALPDEPEPEAEEELPPPPLLGAEGAADEFDPATYGMVDLSLGAAPEAAEPPPPAEPAPPPPAAAPPPPAEEAIEPLPFLDTAPEDGAADEEDADAEAEPLPLLSLAEDDAQERAAAEARTDSPEDAEPAERFAADAAAGAADSGPGPLSDAPADRQSEADTAEATHGVEALGEPDAPAVEEPPAPEQGSQGDSGVPREFAAESGAPAAADEDEWDAGMAEPLPLLDEPEEAAGASEEAEPLPLLDVEEPGPPEEPGTATEMPEQDWHAAGPAEAVPEAPAPAGEDLAEEDIQPEWSPTGRQDAFEEPPEAPSETPPEHDGPAGGLEPGIDPAAFDEWAPEFDEEEAPAPSAAGAAAAEAWHDSPAAEREVEAADVSTGAAEFSAGEGYDEPGAAAADEGFEAQAEPPAPPADNELVPWADTAAALEDEPGVSAAEALPGADEERVEAAEPEPAAAEDWSGAPPEDLSLPAEDDFAAWAAGTAEGDDALDGPGAEAERGSEGERMEAREPEPDAEEDLFGEAPEELAARGFFEDHSARGLEPAGRPGSDEASDSAAEQGSDRDGDEFGVAEGDRPEAEADVAPLELKAEEAPESDVAPPWAAQERGEDPGAADVGTYQPFEPWGDEEDEPIAPEMPAAREAEAPEHAAARFEDLRDDEFDFGEMPGGAAEGDAVEASAETTDPATGPAQAGDAGWAGDWDPWAEAEPEPGQQLESWEQAFAGDRDVVEAPEVQSAPAGPSPAELLADARGLAQQAGAGVGDRLMDIESRLARLEAYREALTVARLLIEREPDRREHHQRRVDYAGRLEDQTELVAAYLDLAECLVRGGLPMRAGVVYQQILDLDPTNAVARARIHGEQPSRPQQQQFVDLGTLLQSEEPDDPNSTRFVVAEKPPTGDDQHDFADMLSQFKAKVAETVGVDDPGSHYDLGLAFKEMGLIDEAIGEFQTALRGGEERLKVYEELGQCFMQKEQYHVAVKVLSRALQLPGSSDEDLLGVYYHLGRCNEELGRRGEAKDAYERVVGLDLQFRDVAARLARL